MSKIKGSSGETLKRKKKIAFNKRRRRAYVKQDPELYEIAKDKEKQRYKKRKKRGQFESINDKSPREQRIQRKKWREAAKKYREKKKSETKERQLTIKPVFINLDDGIESNIASNENKPKDAIIDNLKEFNCNCSAKFRRLRYLELKKRARLLKVIIELRRENARLKQKSYDNVIKHQEKNKILDIKHKSKINKNSPLKQKHIKNLIKDFYTDDANSTICSGKKQYITRFKVQKQRRYLRGTIKDLYSKFLKLHRINVSYATFWRYRPFWVLPASAAQRDTCMCIVHANIDLKLESLSNAGIIQEKNFEEMLDSLCCSRFDEKCLKRECDLCKNNILKYNEFLNDKEIILYKWIRSQELVTLKTGTKTRPITRKEEFKTKPLDIINELHSYLTPFFDHCFLIQTQYNNLKNLKNSLTVNAAVIHIDFSQNYALKATNEVQSLHFGGSRKELCLHTAVIYAFDFQISDIKASSVCTVSEYLKHDAPAVWAHLIPLINKAMEINPFINILHFQSDSPTSQYRNKYMFHIMTQLSNDFPQITELTWNYTESGHGKGAADGVGSTVKRMADFAVNHGTDITSIEKFITVVQPRTNITMFVVDKTEVDNRVKMIPDKLQTFNGTLSVHQVLWERNCNRLTLRTSSCFKCTYGQVCSHGKHLGFMAIASSCGKPKSQAKNKSQVTTLKMTKQSTLSDVTNLPSTSHVQNKIVAKPSNVKILSNKLLILHNKSINK